MTKRARFALDERSELTPTPPAGEGRHTIWKFEIKPGRTELPIPLPAEILSAGLDPQGLACVWVRLDPNQCAPQAGPACRAIRLRMTGEKHKQDGRFIGTVVVGAIVGHVFEEAPDGE